MIISITYPGVGNLRILQVKVATKVLEQSIHVDFEFVVMDTHRRGVKPACDAALTALLGEQMKTLVLYEYKPAILAGDEVMLGEVLLQAYYCLMQDELKSLVCCLTDMSTWQYMSI